MKIQKRKWTNYCYMLLLYAAAAAAKLLQSCPTLCDPRDGSPLGSPIPGILQARTLEWVAISFSNAWKWSRSVVSDSLRPHGLEPTRLLCPWNFPGKSTGVGAIAFSTAIWLNNKNSVEWKKLDQKNTSCMNPSTFHLYKVQKQTKIIQC